MVYMDKETYHVTHTIHMYDSEKMKKKIGWGGRGYYFYIFLPTKQTTKV